MMYQLTVQEVTYQDYPVQSLPAMSSKEEKISINEILDVLLSIMLKKGQLEKTLSYRTLLSLLETDSSSVRPRFEMKSDTSLIKEITEKLIVKELLLALFLFELPHETRLKIQRQQDHQIQNLIKYQIF